jgi:ATP-dependent DNA helicase RecG
LSIKDLLKAHRSLPRNKLVANTIYKTGMIETWGRGIDKINRGCVEYGQEILSYETRGNEFKITFKNTFYIKTSKQLINNR